MFRRAKAHVGAWNPEDAKNDFKKVAEVDKTMEKAVAKELRSLTELEKQKTQEDKQKLQGKMFK